MTHAPLAAGAAALVAALVLAAVHPAHAHDIRIENRRGVALEKLRIVAKDSGDGAAYILASDLDAGRHTTMRVPKGACLYDVHGTFADSSTLNAADMDLCRQTTLRLVE